MNKSFTISPTVHQYLCDHCVSETPIQIELREATAKLPGAIMQISPEQGQFMGLLVKLTRAKKILEVGTFTGYSALAMALALPEDGVILTCDTDENTTKIAKTFWQKAKVDNKIQSRLAPALDTLDELLIQNHEGSFDLVFIDADKRNYDAYYEKSLRLIKQNGLILIDNVLWSGRVADARDTDKRTEAIREFNQKLAQDERVMISMLPISDGLTLAVKK